MAKDVRITVVRKTEHRDLMEKYENPIENACPLEEGMVFPSRSGLMPEGFCEEAWKSLSPFALAFAHGAQDFFDGWMKNPESALVSCNDGFRPVSFLLETMED